MKYKVLRNLGYDQRSYKPGEEVEISAADADMLLSSGTIEPLNKPFGKMRRTVEMETETKGGGTAGDLNSLIRAVHQAADAVIAKIQQADQEIAELETERSSLTEAAVSRAEFMAYVRADIERRGAPFKDRLKHFQAKWFQNSFARLERTHSDGNHQAIPYLTAEVPHSGAEMTPAALYWLFGDLIAKRFDDALSVLPWPEKSVPVKDRRARIAAIDQAISELKERRDALAADLAGTGMYG